MTEKYKTFAEIVELEPDKLMLVCVVNKKQLEEINNVFDPLSRSWRGQFQSLAKSIVEAYHQWEKNKF